MGSSKLAVAIVALYFLTVGSINAQHLTSVKCNGVLPAPRAYSAILYDHVDSIYIFGGAAENNFADVIRYSISQDTVEIVAHLPSPSWGGSVVMNKFRNIFYLSGTGSKEIYQYYPDLRSFVGVTSFARDNHGYATIMPDPDTVLLFGGEHLSTSVVSLNLNTLRSEDIARLPENATFPSAIWVEEQNSAYIFYGNIVQKYRRSSNSAERLSLQVPINKHGMAAVSDGSSGYLIGSIFDRNFAQSLLKFHPETERFSFVPLVGYPPVDFSTVVYVEKFNRIYAFGGFTANYGYHDEIYYIDLHPMSPPPTTTTEGRISTMNPGIFNCAGRPDSNYAYPWNCAKFVICREGNGYPFDCPAPLHFDPLNRHCTFSDKAGCA